MSTPQAAGVRCIPEDFRPLIEKGMAIKRAVMATRDIQHPFEPDLGFLYGTIFIGPPQEADAHSRNVCVFAEGEVDRSPDRHRRERRGWPSTTPAARSASASGSSSRASSAAGSAGRVARDHPFGPHAAVIPEVEGTAHITGRHEFLIDPSDPLRNGFILR